MKKGRTSRTFRYLPGVDSPELTTVYFRRQDQLSARDRADLEAYAEVLRPHYDIPEGEPVFAELDEEEPPIHSQEASARKPKPRATGFNHDTHPWRGTL